jgi:hypothetical protein
LEILENKQAIAEGEEQDTAIEDEESKLLEFEEKTSGAIATNLAIELSIP